MGRSPTHNLKYFNKITKENGTIGRAWENGDGSFSIRLNPKVVIFAKPDETLLLFPRDWKKEDTQEPVGGDIE